MAQPAPWALAQYLGQGAHEHVVAPVGLQIAVDKGDDIVLAGQRQVLIQDYGDIGLGRPRRAPKT